ARTACSASAPAERGSAERSSISTRRAGATPSPGARRRSSARPSRCAPSACPPSRAGEARRRPVDLSFSPAQQLLQQSARAFLLHRCPPERVGFAAALAMGERICTLALLEGPARLESGRLNGRQLFVPDAHVATDVIVLGSGAAGPTALLLPMDRAGIAAHPLDSMTGDKLFELVFT